MARTAKKKIKVLDEGILLTDDADSLDFQGSSVSGVAVNNDITETINPASGGFIGTSFETVVQNLKSYNVTATTYSASVLTKTFDIGGGNTIVMTLNFSNGLPTTKVLSGTLPAGLTQTTCTYDFSGGRVIPLKTYS